MEADDYSFRLERVHFRTCALHYTEGGRYLMVYLEQSPAPEFDWVGSDDDFQHWTSPSVHISEQERKLILSRLEQWSSQSGVKIHIASPADWRK